LVVKISRYNYQKNKNKPSQMYLSIEQAINHFISKKSTTITKRNKNNIYKNEKYIFEITGLK